MVTPTSAPAVAGPGLLLVDGLLARTAGGEADDNRRAQRHHGQFAELHSRLPPVMLALTFISIGLRRRELMFRKR